MKAIDALEAARAAGITLAVDGDDLVLEAASTPPAAALDALSQHKAEIVALLRPGRDGWSAEDWQVFFDERASIAEFDGGLSRADAEAQAFGCCVIEWLDRHPEHSQDRPGRSADLIVVPGPQHERLAATTGRNQTNAQRRPVQGGAL
jgi:hypothetical protein